MKDKIISYEGCVSIFQPNSQRSFGTVSPTNIISGPNVPLLYSWVGSVSYTSIQSIAFGTIDRWRPDPNDQKPLNHDQWVLWSTGTANLIRVMETKKSNISDHWSTALPSEVQKDSPNWVNTFVDEMIRNK